MIGGMSEYLCVDGIGIGRESALGHADLKAARYFGIEVSDVSRLDRTIGRATADLTMDSEVDLCTVSAEYRRPEG